MLKPSPALVHSILTHFHWFWDLVNNSLLQDIFMRFVLTGGWNMTLLAYTICRLYKLYSYGVNSCPNTSKDISAVPGLVKQKNMLINVKIRIN